MLFVTSAVFCVKKQVYIDTTISIKKREGERARMGDDGLQCVCYCDIDLELILSISHKMRFMNVVHTH